MNDYSKMKTRDLKIERNAMKRDEYLRNVDCSKELKAINRELKQRELRSLIGL